MPIIVQCLKCLKRINVPDHFAGKVGKCPACGDALRIPALDTALATPQEDTPEPLTPKQAARELEQKSNSRQMPANTHTQPPALPQRSASSSKPTVAPAYRPRRQFNRSPQLQIPTAGAHWAAGAFALLAILGCLLPWMQIGVLFVIKGIDTHDGQIALFLALGAAGAAAYNLFGSGNKIRWPYIVASLLLLILAAADLSDIHKRAKIVAEGLSDLSRIVGGEKVESWELIGTGLYCVFVGAGGLFISALTTSSSRPMRYSASSSIASNSSSNSAPSGTTTLCFECGQYFDGAPRFCPHCGKPTKFNQ